MRRVAAACLACLVAAGCGGPRRPLRIGGKSVAVNVAFGEPERAPQETSAPEVVTVPRPPRLRQTAGPTPAPRPFALPPPPPEACPRARGFPEREASITIVDPPAVATYTFRAQIRQKQGTDEVAYDGPVTRTVRRGEVEGDTFNFLVEEDILGAVQTTYGYHVDPSRLALTGTVVRAQGEVLFSFVPATPVTILPLPPVTTEPNTGTRFDTWRSAGTDPTTQISMTIDGQALETRRINACGRPVDSWVTHAETRMVGPGLDWTTTHDTNYATQYGGLIASESVKRRGTVSVNTPYELDFRVTINSTPKT